MAKNINWLAKIVRMEMIKVVEPWHRGHHHLQKWMGVELCAADELHIKTRTYGYNGTWHWSWCILLVLFDAPPLISHHHILYQSSERCDVDYIQSIHIMLVCLFILVHLYPFFCSPLNGITSHKNVLIEFTIITEAAFQSIPCPRYSGHVLTVHDKDFNSLSQQRLTFTRTTMAFTE